MTSLAMQDEAQLGGPWSVLTRQKRDHVLLDRLLEALPRTPGPEQDEVLQRIYRLVFPHAFAEESVLWPVMRRVLPDGEQLTRQVEEEHQEVNELVTRLDGDKLTPAEREAVLDRLVEVLREDVRDEEDELLPRLQERLSRQQLQRLGVAWEAVRRMAPTRPHPVVARRPPGNVLAALPLTVLDRSRDRAESGVRRGPEPVREPLARLSGALAAGAGRVERLGIMRRGEAPTTHVDEAG
ncbi:hemerythrin domain-containing protein [Nocardioides campestrisoli]|uniref:hemerythrin domain-containing protein n=1 Tax=Nocardioides campestrisoli TaxID=2736757 RepID=UPI0015E65CC9|nr:hemerythrin domain-containing protein [Nocardioides campestrisoli]